MRVIQSLDKIDQTITVKFKQVYADPLINLKKYTDALTGIGAGLDKNGLPVTGLTEDVEVRAKAGAIPTKVKGTRLLMEEKLDLPEGTLKNTSPYWYAYKVNIGSDAIDLVLSDPHDLLKYLFLYAQSIVATGFKEIGESSKVVYVLYSPEQESQARVQAKRVLKDAYVLSDKLDGETRVNILAVYGLIVDASNPNTIEDKINEKIEENPSKFMSIVNDDDLIYKSLITKCLDKGILTNEDGGIMHGEINVGYDKNTAATAVKKDGGLQAVLRAKLSGDMDMITKALNEEKKPGKK